MVGYYDMIFAALTGVIVAGALVGMHPAIELHQGLAGGSLFSTFFVYEMLFRNPPTEPSPQQTAGTLAVGASWALTLVLFL